VAVASAGPHANHLHLALNRQPRYTLPLSFFQSGRPSRHPTNSVKALKALSYLLIKKIKLMKDEERMRPGHWMGSVLWVSFSAFTLLAGWQEWHLDHKTCTASQRFFSWPSGTRNHKVWGSANPGSPGTRL